MTCSVCHRARGDERVAALSAYQVNEALMAHAPAARLLHCLPAHRGEEVSAGVIDGPQSAVFDQAENRLHAQKALLAHLLAPPAVPAQGSRVHACAGASMGTTWSARVVLAGDDAAHVLQAALQAELDAIVVQMSHWDEDSLLSRYNRAPAGTSAAAVSEAWAAACGDPGADAADCAKAVESGDPRAVAVWGHAVDALADGLVTALTLLGCVPWVLMLGLIGREVGDNWEEWRDKLHYLDYLVIAVVVGGLIWLLIRRWRDPKPPETETETEPA